MKAPVGGDCGGVTSNFGSSVAKVSSSEETNSRTTAIEVEHGRVGATTMAGSGVLAMQQFVSIALVGCDV